MKSIGLLTIAVIFIGFGIVSITSPTVIRNWIAKDHKEGLKDFGASDQIAEEYVKKYIPPNELIYRIVGFIFLFFGGMLFYAVVKTLLKS